MLICIINNKSVAFLNKPSQPKITLVSQPLVYAPLAWVDCAWATIVMGLLKHIASRGPLGH